MEKEIIWKEIYEQPEIISKLLAVELKEINKIVDQLDNRFNNITDRCQGVF